MLGKNKILLLALLLLNITSCSKIDDYLLGKDNSPYPGQLPPAATLIKFHEKWRIVLGASVINNYNLKLKPLVLAKKIYATNGDNKISAINRHDGHVIWSKKLSAHIVSGPIMTKSALIVGTDASTLIALNPANGQVMWQVQLSGEVLAKPLIVNNKVIAKTIDGNVYCFNLITGTSLWTNNHGSPNLILKTSASPVILDKKLILVGFSDGKLDAIDSETGQVVLQKSIAYPGGASDVEQLVDIGADPIVQGNSVLLASYQGYTGLFSLKLSQFAWHQPISTFKNMVIKQDALFITDGHDNLWSINKYNGQINWQQNLLAARNVTAPSVIGDKLIVGDKTGLLHLISTQTGALIARTDVDGPVTIPIAVVDNEIYVITNNGKLSCYVVS